MTFRTRYVVVALVLAAASGCGSNEDDAKSASADTTGTTARPAAVTTETSALSTVQDVLASRIREEFPGVHDTELAVAGGTLTMSFDVGAEEKPGGPRDFARLAAGELETVAPEVLKGLKTVEVKIAAPDGTVTNGSFGLFGDLLPVG